MNFSNIFWGIIGAASLFFLLFPNILDEVRKMDTLRLVVLIVFILCLLYWIYFVMQRSNFLMKLIGSNRPSRRIIRDRQGVQYLVEGKNCYHIPDVPTYEYLGRFFGFDWGDSKEMEHEEINRKFTKGRQLPSITAFFPKIEQK